MCEKLFGKVIWRCAGLLVGSLLLLCACERPFVAPVPPRIEILEPDLSMVLAQPSTPIRIAVTSFRPIAQVTLNGTPLTFLRDEQLWVDTLILPTGLTPLLITATDEAGIAGVDTAFAVHSPFHLSTGPLLPAPRGGHTATLLPDGSVLVVGGVPDLAGLAQPDAFVLSPGAQAFERLPRGLNVARTGHTATLLPDGSVLIVGGGQRASVEEVGTLVEIIERFDPITQRFEVLPVEGLPIRRSLHTASLRQTTDGLLLDLFGGRGDIRYVPEPRLGTRRDVRTFLLREGHLTALNDLTNAPLLAPLSGHTQTPTNNPSLAQPGVFLIAGSFFSNQIVDNVSFKIDFTMPPDLPITEAPPLPTPRTQHAAVVLQEGYIAFFGGRQEQPRLALDQTELYLNEINRFFRFEGPLLPTRRFGLTATKLPAGRILLLGGFSPTGNSLRTSEFFDANLNRLN